MNRLVSTFFLGLLFFGLATAQMSDFTHWVNPFIGTGGHGHTFPGATMPFGMVQLSPDTRTDNWDGSSGYHFSDDIIYGFSHTHLSGTGIPDYCDILFMPMVGEPKYEKASEKSVKGYASRFSHANEHAEPGYYSVKLDDDDILAELTATPRVGVHRYTFPKADEVTILLDLAWRDRVIDADFHTNDTYVDPKPKGRSRTANIVFTQISKTQVEGYRESSSWAKDQKIFFVAEFSKLFDAIIVDDPLKGPNQSPSRTKFLKVAFRFQTRKSEQILLKVALSHVSIEGARKNLAAELPGWDFDKVRADARAAWNKELSKIEVSGGTDAQTTTFYTALYHTMIQPNIFNDVDGNYRGLDGKAHSVGTQAASLRVGKDTQASSLRSRDQYTVFSLWDTFRAAHPLYTIIDQKRTVDFINTFIRQYEQGGRLPVWELAGNETDCMIGYHAVSVIADAMAKGIKGFDYEKAYKAAKHSAELENYGLAAYKRRGYISMEDENESVSKTLEYAYDDWCIAEMSIYVGLERYGKKSSGGQESLAEDYQTYLGRARYFENLFDTETGFMRPKKNGGFVKPFAPNEVTFNFTEGNSWVYSFFVPQDITRLMELQGGRQKFAAKLDELFTTKDKLAGREQPDITGLIGQYAHGNEPSHHIAYLYDYAGEPWKTQNLVRKIMDEFYKPEPDGLIGNEDCGQMSAWYILSAAGFYEVTPGSAVYAFGTPLFPEMKFDLENGKTFTIRAPGTSSINKYIAGATLNGKPYKRAFIEHKEIWKGGVLEFVMTDKPAVTAFTEFPRSSITGGSLAVPLIEGARSFSETTSVTLRTTTPNAKIFYTTNGDDPSEETTAYTGPFTIDDTTTVKAVSIAANGDQSLKAEAAFDIIPNDWTVSIASKYNRQYTGGGDNGLIDGIRGTTNFASGEWQGYQGQDFVATIDLQKETTITKVGGGFLQVARSWIWMPTHVEFETSTDGVNFRKVADIKTDIDPTDMESKIRDYTQTISPTNARYVRVHAYNLGKIPAWHPGAGDEAFIFVDEIIIQ